MRWSVRSPRLWLLFAVAVAGMNLLSVFPFRGLFRVRFEDTCPAPALAAPTLAAAALAANASAAAAASPGPPATSPAPLSALAALAAFERLPVVRRFLARGRRSCPGLATTLQRPRYGQSPASGSAPVSALMNYIGASGLGNLVLKSMMVDTWALLSGREALHHTQDDVRRRFPDFGVLDGHGKAFGGASDHLKNDANASVGCHFVAAQPLGDGFAFQTLTAKTLLDIPPLLQGTGGDVVFIGCSFDWWAIQDSFWEAVTEGLFKDNPFVKNLVGSSTARLRHCMARVLFERPSSELAATVIQTLESLGPRDLLLGVHLRFGDKHVFQDMAERGAWDNKSVWAYNTDQRFRQDEVPGVFQKVCGMIQDLELGGAQTVRLYVATDLGSNSAVAELAEKYFGQRLLKILDGDAHHSYVLQATPEADQVTAKMFAEWYLLALSDVLVLPMYSTFSSTAFDMGMQRGADFPWSYPNSYDPSLPDWRASSSPLWQLAARPSVDSGLEAVLHSLRYDS